MVKFVRDERVDQLKSSRRTISHIHLFDHSLRKKYQENPMDIAHIVFLMGKLVLFDLRQAALTHISCFAGVKCDQISEVSNRRAALFLPFERGCASGASAVLPFERLCFRSTW
jgi:hypothetical protein